MKPFSVKFKLDAKILAIIYICYHYKFPASFMLSFYEMYEEQSLFILKAMSCARKINLTDSSFIKILNESILLHKQILAGISVNIKRNQLINQIKNGKIIDEVIPNCPTLDLSKFSEEYKQFIQYYLLNNVKDIFTEQMELQLDTNDLYVEMKK